MAVWSDVSSDQFTTAALASLYWSNVLSDQFTTVSGGFAIINVDGDNVVSGGQTNVTISVTQAGTTPGKVFWGGVQQPIDSWSDTAIVISAVNSTGLTPGQPYAWQVWRPNG